ncbi:MAG: hypothetical protein BWY74_03269 [Firmicutes bacterium ADurb.Bin419]|nr:MAG: hypothetical protein BWY74_03269 [Firmicutes bacterium ADurb.Bin419]
MKINLKYLTAFLLLFVTEVLIALFVKDKIIRPFIGDVLVIILMYTFIRGIIKKTIKGLPVYLFIFAGLVEVSQYFHLVDRLNLRNNRLMATIMGTSFDIRDILCYLAGTIMLIIWERLEKSKDH